MNLHRRDFLRALGLAGAGIAGVGALGLGFSPRLARAARDPLARLIDEVGLQPLADDDVPRVINLFLYGGPSELAGNLTNIADIDANSQNPYPLQLADPGRNDTQVTPNGMWADAGGTRMETLVAGGVMGLYRTLHRIKEDSKAHGPSVTQNLLGTLESGAPGMGTRVAELILAHEAAGRPLLDKPSAELILPLVSFEGETRLFNVGDATLPPTLKPVALDSRLRNPYQRDERWPLDRNHLEADRTVEALAQRVGAAQARLARVHEAFVKRAEMAERLGDLLSETTVNEKLATYNAAIRSELGIADEGVNLIDYGDNQFGNKLRAAVSLMLENPDTLFVALGSNGLGGWDDHSEALDEYPGRMDRLFQALEAAMAHLKAAARYDGRTHAGNVIINVFGEFGRNVNLNNSIGWDHGNNQNLYTLGGWNLRPEGLGKIVGKTYRIGSRGQNRQFTTPTDDSYQCEPFAVASLVYRVFGAENPQAINGEAPLDTQAPGEPLAAWTPAPDSRADRLLRFLRT